MAKPKSQLEIYLLGPPEVHRDGCLLPPLATAKSRSLFAYLVLYRARLHSRDALAALFWGDRDETHARHSLATAMWRIRSMLGADYILADTSSVQFNPDNLYWLDVAEFELNLEAAQHRHDQSSAANLLQRAVVLYRGDFVEGNYDDWCIQERYRLEALYLEALARLVQYYEHRGDSRSVLAYAQRLLARDPLNESLHLASMRAYMALGDQGGARKQWKQCCETRQQELDLPPSVEMLEQAKSILGDYFTVPLPLEPLPRTVLSRPGTLERPPFVGRARELGALLTRWEQAASAQGSLVFISGEAGLGKSRLVEELSQGIRERGGWVTSSQCYEYERAAPYGPLADLLRSCVPLFGTRWLEQVPAWRTRELTWLLPELGERRIQAEQGTGMGSDQTRLFEALTLSFLDLAQQNPLLLVLEDLHYASDSILGWLHYFARRINNSPILMLTTFRSEEIGSDHTLARMTIELEQKGYATRLELTGLTEAALARWLSGAQASVVERLYRQTEGNPFFTLETLRALVEEGMLQLVGHNWIGDASAEWPIPGSVAQVIEMRLNRLGAKPREAVETAAVIGRRFDLEVLRESLHWDEETTLQAVDELLRRRLIREGTGTARWDYEFDHHLVHEVVYHQLQYRRRRRIHRLVAEGLERLYSNRAAGAAELAHHLVRANDPRQALPYLFEAGQQAAIYAAHQEALSYWDQAFTILSDLSAVEQTQFRGPMLEALTARAELFYLQGRVQERQADLRQLHLLAEQTGDRLLLDRALVREAHYLNLDGQFSQAIERAQTATHRCRERGDVEGETRALAEWGFAHYFRGEYDLAMRVLNLALAAEQVTPSVRGEILSVLSYLHYLGGDYARSLDYRRQAHTIRSGLGQLARVAEDLTDLGILYTQLDQITQGEQSLLEALALARKIGSQPAESYALNNLGNLHYLRGDYAEALHCYQDSLPLQRATGSRRGESSALCNTGTTLLALGDYEAARDLLKQALAIQEEIGYESGISETLARLALVLSNLNLSQEAFHAANQSLEVAHRIQNPNAQVTALNALSELELARGNPGAAATLSREAMALAKATKLTSGHIMVLALLGLAHLASGECECAAQFSSEAVTRVREQRWIEGPAEQVYFAHYQVMTALGRVEESAAALEEARAEVIRKAAKLPEAQWRDRFLQIHSHILVPSSIERQPP